MRKIGVLLIMLFVLMPASLASAHDPIILTAEQTTPARDPYLWMAPYLLHCTGRWTTSFACISKLKTSGANAILGLCGSEALKFELINKTTA